jgi:hypothetical protein
MQTIETTAGQATAELQKRGIGLANRITIVVETAADHFLAARAEARANVIAAGLSDDDIDAMIKQARAEIAAEDQAAKRQ